MLAILVERDISAGPVFLFVFLIQDFTQVQIRGPTTIRYIKRWRVLLMRLTLYFLQQLTWYSCYHKSDTLDPVSSGSCILQFHDATVSLLRCWHILLHKLRSSGTSTSRHLFRRRTYRTCSPCRKALDRRANGTLRSQETQKIR